MSKVSEDLYPGLEWVLLILFQTVHGMLINTGQQTVKFHFVRTNKSKFHPNKSYLSLLLRLSPRYVIPKRERNLYVT